MEYCSDFFFSLSFCHTLTHQHVDSFLGAQHFLGKGPDGGQIGGVQMANSHLSGSGLTRSQLTCATDQLMLNIITFVLVINLVGMHEPD